MPDRWVNRGDRDQRRPQNHDHQRRGHPAAGLRLGTTGRTTRRLGTTTPAADRLEIAPTNRPVIQRSMVASLVCDRGGPAGHLGDGRREDDNSTNDDAGEEQHQRRPQACPCRPWPPPRPPRQRRHRPRSRRSPSPAWSACDWRGPRAAWLSVGRPQRSPTSPLPGTHLGRSSPSRARPALASCPTPPSPWWSPRHRHRHHRPRHRHRPQPRRHGIAIRPTRANASRSASATTTALAAPATVPTACRRSPGGRSRRVRPGPRQRRLGLRELRLNAGRCPESS